MALPVSDALQRFIRERLPSIEQVEIVLLLRSDAARSWSAPEVAERLGTPGESTAMRLFLLASNGVIVFDGSSGARYRYNSEQGPADLMEELERTYHERRESLLELTGGVSRDPLRSFSDAFKLKK